MIPRDPNTMDPDSNPAMHPRVDNAMLPSADIENGSHILLLCLPRCPELVTQPWTAAGSFCA